jgi:hypothetical protein
VPDAEPGKRVPGARTCTRSSKAKKEGTVHRFVAPCVEFGVRGLTDRAYLIIKKAHAAVYTSLAPVVTLDVQRNFEVELKMIVSYRDRRSLDFAAGERVKAFSGVERPARLKLDRLEAATTLKDLAALPGNRI